MRFGNKPFRGILGRIELASHPATKPLGHEAAQSNAFGTFVSRRLSGETLLNALLLYYRKP